MPFSNRGVDRPWGPDATRPLTYRSAGPRRRRRCGSSVKPRQRRPNLAPWLAAGGSGAAPCPRLVGIPILIAATGGVLPRPSTTHCTARYLTQARASRTNSCGLADRGHARATAHMMMLETKQHRDRRLPGRPGWWPISPEGVAALPPLRAQVGKRGTLAAFNCGLLSPRSRKNANPRPARAIAFGCPAPRLVPARESPGSAHCLTASGHIVL